MPQQSSAKTGGREINTFFRRLEIIRYLSESSSSRSEAEIRQHLDSVGAFSAGLSEDSKKKAVNRDLKDFWAHSSHNPSSAANDISDTYVFREGSQASGYRYTIVLPSEADDVSARQRRTRHPAGRLSVPQALALVLTRDFLHDMIPAEHFKHLNSTFSHAKGLLQKTANSTENWDRVRKSLAIFQRGQRLTPPAFSDDILTTIYTAIAKGRCLTGTYTTGSGSQRNVTLRPWGVVFRLPKVYLVASDADDESETKRQYLVHRFDHHTLQVSDTASNIPSDFSLHDWLSAGGMDIAVAPSETGEERYDVMIQIFPRGDGKADNLLADLKESRLSETQKGPYQDSDGNWFILLPQTRITYQLVEWILGRGGRVAVLEPEVLKQRIIGHAKSILSRYESEAPPHTTEKPVRNSSLEMPPIKENKVKSSLHARARLMPGEWPAENACVFSKVNEQWGAYSNMAPLSIRVGNHISPTAEHLFQALRFSGHPEIQKKILTQKSPMAAKMASKPFRDTHTIEGWDEIRVDAMRAVLMLKLRWNSIKFGRVLLDSKGRLIIEKAPKNDASGRFWGAVPQIKETPQMYIGSNVMGQLLMELRDLIIQFESNAENQGGILSEKLIRAAEKTLPRQLNLLGER